MKTITSTLFLFAVLLAFSGCDTNPGPDSISSHTGGQGGGTVTQCTTVCHIPGATLGPDPLTTNGTGTAGKHVAHVTSLGLSCAKCHFNYGSNAAHFNGVVNVQGNFPSPVYFDATNTPGIWSFVTPSGPGTCSNTVCHRSLTPDWYGTVVPPKDPVCSNCHTVPVGPRRQVLGAAGDFATNPSVTSHHVAGGDPASAQCSVCHDQYLHMGGTVRLRQADTGTRIDYDPASPSTLEPFCTSCHDADGALATTLTATGLDPFNDGQALGAQPFVAGTTIAASWNGSSIHRSSGVTCAGTGSPATGCHGRNGAVNAHGSVNAGMLTNSMNFQIPLVSASVYSASPLGSSWSYANYQLCFDCHAASPAVTKEVVLGYRQNGVYDKKKSPTPYYTPGMRSLFRDHYAGIDPTRPYSDTMFGDAYLPLHSYHLLGMEVNVLVDPSVNMLQGKYRGDPARIGRITCTACHNVHGTTSPTIRSTHPELGLKLNSFGVLFPGEAYTSLDSAISTTVMSGFPMNCAVDCHGIQGQSSYWHTPNGD